MNDKLRVCLKTSLVQHQFYMLNYCARNTYEKFKILNSSKSSCLTSPEMTIFNFLEEIILYDIYFLDFEQCDYNTLLIH